jgi:hypothetical protein
MKAGFKVEHYGNINALEGIVVANYESTNTVTNYGYQKLEPGLWINTLSPSDIGVWRHKKRCYDCETTKGELAECERCGSIFCEKHSSVYNQFSQIDYNCCLSCSETKTE